jgi:hemerythrin-like domain-containing protein
MHDIQERFSADHARLQGMFQRLTDTVSGGDLPDVSATWAAFEAGLLAHFETEEAELLPLLADSDPAEARALRAEHDEIRAIVAELGVMTDLHAIRKEVVDRLLDRLRAHAAREDRSLYRLADERLREPERAGVLGALEAARERILSR